MVAGALEAERKGGLCFVGRDNESRVIYPERLGQ